MNPARFNFRKALLVSAMALSASATTFVMAAEPASVQTAVQRYSIPVGSLADGLMQLANAAGVTVQFSSGITDGLDTVGLEGEYTLEQGFAVLLQGSGLEVVNQGSGVYILRAANVAGTGIAELAPAIVNANSTGLTEGTGSYTTNSMSTATGLNLSIRETPQSVTVITDQAIEDQNLRSVSDILKLTPGVYIITTYDAADSFAMVRGFQLSSMQLDGQSFNAVHDGDKDLLGSYSTASIDHVEVVRGATGILTGSGSPSGTVNIVRKRPTENFQASIEASVANYDDWSSGFDVGGSLTESGNLRARLVANIEEQKDSVRGFYGRSKPTFYGVIDMNLSEKTLLSVALDYNKTEINGQGWSVASPPAWDRDGNILDWPRSLNLAADWNRVDQQDQSAMFTLKHSFSDKWAMQVAYTLREGEGERYYTVPDAYSYSNDGNYLARSLRLIRDNDSNTFQLSLNGGFELFGRDHELVIGYINSNQDAKEVFSVGADSNGIPNFGGGIYNVNTFNPASSIVEPVNWFEFMGAEFDIRQSAIYANTRLHLAEPLSLLLGMRVSSYKQQEIDAVSTMSSSDYDHDNVVTPYVGLVYDISESLSTYASFAEIFQIQDNSVRDASGNLLDPKESTNLEIGIKAELLNNQLTASLAVFRIEEDGVATVVGQYTEQEDILLYGDDYYSGEDGVKTEGFELEISGQLTSNWQIMGGYTYQTYDNSDGSERLTGNPEKLFKLASRYQFNGKLRKLAIGGSVNWRSSVFVERAVDRGAAETVFVEQDAFAPVDFWGEYQVTDMLTARINISNLFDEKYRSGVSAQARYGENRRIRVSVNYNF